MTQHANNIKTALKNKKIVLFDGVCNLCNSAVQLIIKKDSKASFVFASLQDINSQKYLSKHAPKLLKTDSILLITPHKIYTKSSAALIIAKNLKGLYPLLYLFYAIPKPIRDVVYDFIAKNRYKWFGKKEFCVLPNPDYQNRFL